MLAPACRSAARPAAAVPRKRRTGHFVAQLHAQHQLVGVGLGQPHRETAKAAAHVRKIDLLPRGAGHAGQGGGARKERGGKRLRDAAALDTASSGKMSSQVEDERRQQRACLRRRLAARRGLCMQLRVVRRPGVGEGGR